MNTTAKGNRLELDVQDALESPEGLGHLGGDWLTGSRRHRRKEPGSGDVTAQKSGERGLLVECKEDARGPWNNFKPHEREATRATAKKHGVVAVVAWRASPSKPITLIDEAGWP